VRWVHQESQAVADSFRLPAAIRNKALLRFSDQMFRRRFLPLAAPP
jgi:hypothetical protein